MRRSEAKDLVRRRCSVRPRPSRSRSRCHSRGPRSPPRRRARPAPTADRKPSKRNSGPEDCPTDWPGSHRPTGCRSTPRSREAGRCRHHRRTARGFRKPDRKPLTRRSGPRGWCRDRPVSRPTRSGPAAVAPHRHRPPKPTRKSPLLRSPPRGGPVGQTGESNQLLPRQIPNRSPSRFPLSIPSGVKARLTPGIVRANLREGHRQPGCDKSRLCCRGPRTIR